MPSKAAANNIVLFPPDRVKNPLRTAVHSEVAPKNISEIKNALDLVKTKRTNEIIELVMPLLIQAFAVYGINYSEEDPRYFVMIVEAVRSLVYRHYKMHHPLQELTEHIFELKNGKLEVSKINVREIDDNGKNSN